jgi:hypothetical protein
MLAEAREREEGCDQREHQEGWVGGDEKEPQVGWTSPSRRALPKEKALPKGGEHLLETICTVLPDQQALPRRPMLPGNDLVEVDPRGQLPCLPDDLMLAGIEPLIH